MQCWGGGCSQHGWWEGKSQLAANAKGVGIQSTHTNAHMLYIPWNISHQIEENQYREQVESKKQVEEGMSGSRH